MKLHLFFLSALFSVVQVATAQVPTWAWARGSYDPVSVSHTGTMSIATDNFGNEYVTGYLESNYIILGTDTVFKSNGGFSDAFLIKYNAAGNVVWAKGIGGTNNGATGYSVKTDLAGNVFLTGFLENGTMVIGTDTIRNDSLHGEMFIVKLDSSGNALWARNALHSSMSGGYSVASDMHGNAVVVGMFLSPSITFGSFTLTGDSIGYSNLFIVKYDAAGNVLWAKSPHGSNGNVWDIATDNAGSVYITGDFSTARMIFDTDTLHNDSIRTGEICVAKYDSAGTVLWAKSARGKRHDYSNALATFGTDYLYITGYFQSDTLKFGSVTLTTDSFGGDVPTMFIAKYNAVNGNVIWAEKARSGWCMGEGVAADASGNAYVTGSFQTPIAVFGPDTLRGIGSSFVTKYNNTGTEVWAKGGGNFRSSSNAIALDPSGSIYVTGAFRYDSLFVLGTDTLHSSPMGVVDLFVAKLSNFTATTGAAEVLTHKSLMVYPVPNSGAMTIACTGKGYTAVNIYDAQGRKVYTKAIDPTITNPVIEINIAGSPKGMYLVQAAGCGECVTKQVFLR